MSFPSALLPDPHIVSEQVEHVTTRLSLMLTATLLYISSQELFRAEEHEQRTSSQKRSLHVPHTPKIHGFRLQTSHGFASTNKTLIRPTLSGKEILSMVPTAKSKETTKLSISRVWPFAREYDRSRTWASIDRDAERFTCPNGLRDEALFLI